MKHTLYVARRLSLSSGGKRVSPAVGVATAAVALSVAVMLAAIAVVGGFKREIQDKVIGFNSHLTISAASGESDNLVSLSPSLRRILDETPFVTSYSLEAAMPAILKTPTDFKGVYFKALDGESGRSFIERNLESGTVPDFSQESASVENPRLLVSAVAARELGLKTGEKVDVYFISEGVKVRRMIISGIFNSHFEAYDNIYIYGSKSLIDELAGLASEKGTALHVSTDSFERVDAYADSLSGRLDRAFIQGEIYKPYKVETARERGRNYFSWLALLDTNVIVVLVLMTLVGCITLISGLLIIILDKISFIGVMKALGAADGWLRNVFIYVSLRVAVVGMLVGNILMLGLLWIQERYHLIPLDADSYYIDFVPVEISLWPVVALNAGVVLIIWLSLILPSQFVAKISPSTTMRYQ